MRMVLESALSNPELLSPFVLSLAVLCSAVVAFSMCICCKKQIKQDEADSTYAPVANGNSHTDSSLTLTKRHSKVGKTQGIGQQNNEQTLIPVSKDTANLNGTSCNVHRALPSLPASEGGTGTLTRESSTSELYATVEKGAAELLTHTYSKIKSTPADALYTRVDSSKTWHVAPSNSQHQYEYPNFTKPPVIQANANHPLKLIRDPVYSQVDSESDSAYTSVKPAPKAGPSAEDPYKDPTYAYIPNSKAMGKRMKKSGVKDKNDLSMLYTRPLRRHSDGKLGLNCMPGPSSRPDDVCESPVPPVPAKLMSVRLADPQPISPQRNAPELPRRQPSYKYITVRESLEKLRARLQAQAANPLQRTQSDPSLHYYATIGSEHSYEVVPNHRNHQLYEVVQERATVPPPPAPAHVTVVQIDKLTSGSTGRSHARAASVHESSFDTTDDTMRGSSISTSTLVDTMSNIICPPLPPTSPIPDMPTCSFAVRNSPSRSNGVDRLSVASLTSPLKPNVPTSNLTNGHSSSNNVHFGSITFGQQPPITHASAEMVWNSGHTPIVIRERMLLKHNDTYVTSAERLNMSASTDYNFERDRRNFAAENGPENSGQSPASVRYSPEKSAEHTPRCSAERELLWASTSGELKEEEMTCFCHCSNPQPEKVMEVNLKEMERSNRAVSVDKYSVSRL